jgi:hypothetical protein
MEKIDTGIVLSSDEFFQFLDISDYPKMNCKVNLSYEAYFDFSLRKDNNFSRGPDITEQEMQDWKHFDNILNNLDWENARKRVHIIDSYYL